MERQARATDSGGLDRTSIATHGGCTSSYDQLVGSRTVRRPGLDAAVLRLTPSYRGLAVSLDGPPLGERDPFLAGARATLEAARNVACAGGEPLGLTDCLNFGNPEKPEIGWELSQAIEGIAQAAEALGIPVVSGNVSLYNETAGRPILPTPIVGCVGLVPDVRRVPRGWREGDVVLATTRDEFDLQREAELDLVPLASRAALLARPRRLGRARTWPSSRRLAGAASAPTSTLPRALSAILALRARRC